MARRPSEDVIAFIECLTVPSGEGGGGPMRLREWQRQFIRDVYDPVRPNGRRWVRRAVLSIARKNGKTALAACLVLVHLIGPMAVVNGEIYSAANDQKQAAQVFKFVRQMVELDPDLGAMLEVTKSTKNVFCPSNGSFYTAISAEAGTKHGLNPSMVIFDELAQARDEELYDVLNTSMGARAEPLFLTISTQSNDSDHILSKLIDAGLDGDDKETVCHLYAAPDDLDIDDVGAHRAANPALGDFRDLDDLMTLMRQAQKLPSREPAFRNLYLNQRVSPLSPLISAKSWAALPSGTIKPGERIYLGLDLGFSSDFAALVAVSEETGAVACWAWKAGDTLDEHGKRDRKDYRLWAAEGHLIAPDGPTVPIAAVAHKIAEITRTYDVVLMAYDRWRIDLLLNRFDEIGFQAQQGDGAGLKLHPWGQGMKDMSPSLDALENAVLNKTITNPGSKVLTWNLANAIVRTDEAGNRKLDKSKSRFRIDAAVALAMAIGAKEMIRGEKPLINPWMADESFSLTRLN